MNALIRFFTALTILTKRLSICANVGMIAGCICGTLLTIVDLTNGSIILTQIEVWYLTLMLGLFCWIVLIFFLCFLSGYTFISVAIPALINCMITCFLTILICYLMHHFMFAWLIGMIIGIIVGSLLCYLNTFFKKLIA